MSDIIIEEGDGTFAKRFSDGKCPSCEGDLKLERDDEVKKVYRCVRCKLAVFDVKLGGRSNE